LKYGVLWKNACNNDIIRDILDILRDILDILWDILRNYEKICR
jgi:hypothetical protein